MGIAAYLTKPITQAELWEALVMVLHPSVSAAAPAPLVTRHTLRESRRPLRILLAEDNPVNQRLAVRLLEKQGHTVPSRGPRRFSTSGQIASSYARIAGTGGSLMS